MLKKESIDMFQAGTAPDDIAVKLESVSKSFTQWRRNTEPSEDKD